MNKGFDRVEIDRVRTLIAGTAGSYIAVEPETNNDEYQHFMFIGIFEGEEAIFDAIAYTLRLQHETEIFERAESEAMKMFPEFEKGEDLSPEKEEEVGLFMAEAIAEMEEESAVKVSEHIDLDTEIDFGVGFEAGLNVEKITRNAIEELIAGFNNDTIVLDETLISFQTHHGGETPNEDQAEI